MRGKAVSFHFHTERLWHRHPTHPAALHCRLESWAFPALLLGPQPQCFVANGPLILLHSGATLPAASPSYCLPCPRPQCCPNRQGGDGPCGPNNSHPLGGAGARSPSWPFLHPQVCCKQPDLSPSPTGLGAAARFQGVSSLMRRWNLRESPQPGYQALWETVGTWPVGP